MLRKLTVIACTLAAMGLAVPAQAGCPGCKKVADKGAGFCCGKGSAYGVQLTSKKLFEAVMGAQVEPASLKCADCKAALKTNGTCTHCNVSFVDGRAFHSKIGYILASGRAFDKQHQPKCPGCKAVLAKGGVCEHCKVGFVGGRAYHGKERIDAAERAHATLVKAAEVAKHCEACAIALITNGTCKQCKVKFKDGKPL